MKKIFIIMAVAGMSVLTSCDDVWDPAKQNFKDVSQMESEPDFAMGFLTKAYSAVADSYRNTEYATDDAVVNQNGNSYRSMATGGWTSSSSPINEWTNSYAGIQYLNQFLSKVDEVVWSTDTERSDMLRVRMEAEARALRAILHYQLLRTHSGYDNGGNLLGVPYLESYLGANDDMNLTRPSYKDCVAKIVADLNHAIEVLPLDYEDCSEVPDRYKKYTNDPEVYNRTMGANFRQLVSGRIAMAYLSRVTLLAASDGFANTCPWEEAANAAAAVLKENNGVAGIGAGTPEYYSASIADKLKEGVNPAEIIWRGNVGEGNGEEKNNMPPSVNGNGNMNPSQNLVDAFPMANGYPINMEAANYDPANPYAGRDPRLNMYIIYNGSKGVGVTSAVISTVQGTTDGVGNVEQRSTNTGYYMKKRLRMDVNLTAGSETKKNHYTPRVRYTEIYLNYAEAANETWGPKGDGGNGFSAYDVIKAIRQRAGVGGAEDPYLEECAASTDKMRQLIRNERRLELCFEDSRFWDLRRWKADLNTPVMGINWKDDGTYEIFEVEKRSYEDYMNYPPIPNSEILKYSNLMQNKGW